MTISQSRVLKFVQPHSADLLVLGLIDALNGGRADWKFDYRQDVLIGLVRELQKLEKEWSNTEARFERRGAGQTPSKAVRRPWQNICEILREYTAYPSLTLRWPQPETNQIPDAAWSLDWITSDGKPLLDLEFSLDAMEIFKAGRISSLKQCDQCGKWFLARFPHQRFCSVECKDQFHTTNEADKKRRREWARANYQTRKELEVGSRKAAKRKGGKR